MMKNKTNVKWKKRAATIVMSLCLLMGLMPIAVFAAGSSAQLPVYTIESEADGDYVKREGVTATFTSDTEFTLGAFQDGYNVYGVKLDYYYPNANPNDYGGLDEGYDILVGCIISLKFTNPTNGSISGKITIPLPSGYDGATARTKEGVTATSYNETTVTFPVTLVISSYDNTALTELYVEYKEKPQHTHSYGDWQKDETNHWRECACGEKADSAAHSYDNDADTTCNVCGYVRTVTASTPSITGGQNEKWTQGSANELIFTSNAPLSEFISVTIDGQVVDEKNYVKEEGSTIIKLKADYLSTLSAGNHTISINSTSGSATTAFTIEKEKPQHTHSYGDWQKDKTNHWRECACGEKADSAAHSYDNDADTTCNVCGYMRTVTASTTTVSPDAKSPKTGDNNNLFLWTTMLCISGLAIFGTRIYSKKEKNIK